MDESDCYGICDYLPSLNYLFFPTRYRELISEKQHEQLLNLAEQRAKEIIESKPHNISQSIEVIAPFKDLFNELNKEKSILYNVYVQKLRKFIQFEEEIIQEHEMISKFPECLQQRYRELSKAIDDDMKFSFFWLAGSIIEYVLCEYCKKNNIKSSKDDIDGYITTLKENNKISTGSTIYATLQYFKQFRNTIHPDNQNNDFINDKNLQNHKQALDDVIKFFTNDNQSD